MPEIDHRGNAPFENASSVEQKIVYSFSYLWGLLFFVPLLLYKDPRSRKVANDGLLLLLLTVIFQALYHLLSLFGGPFQVMASVVTILATFGLLSLGVIGIIWVWTNQDRDLPLIGGLHLIK